MSAPRVTFSRRNIRVLLLEGVHERAVELFREAGYTSVRREAGALDREALKEAVRRVHLIGMRSRTQLDEEVLDCAERLIAAGCFCIGTNQVDLESAALRGVPVFNAPHSNTRSVAELVIGLAVMLFRDVFRKSALAHAGQWQKSAKGARELRGRTLGIVGYGHIGSQVSVLAESMGMRVLFHDIRPVLAMGNAQPQVDLAHVLQKSDLVTLHVPDTPVTRGLIGAGELAAMRPGAHLVNASRGSVVDAQALAAALESGHLGGAAVDVFAKEPKTPDEEFENPLRGFDNVILTPHVGGSTQEAQQAIAVDVASKLIAYSDSGTTTAAVNFPQLNLAAHEGCHRVLHIHRNEPGVLAQINDVFSAHDTNIQGQHLQTLNGVGYVVTDVDEIAAEEVLPTLRAIKGTLRARILYYGCAAMRTSLNIGPSEVSAAVRADLVEIAARGLLSESHRGAIVKAEVTSAVANLRSALRVPDDYGICFQPSATASMELILRNCVRACSFHIVQGAFADRFARTAAEIGLDAGRYEGKFDLPPAWREVEAPKATELIALTHNETSTGEAWPWEDLQALRARDPEPLIAIDVTSSVGGMAMPWRAGDLWFGSVQKCLGLPAGLGFVLAGPRALARARDLGPARHVAGWQDLPALIEKLGSGQTPETPNVLGIALLGRQMARWDLERIEAETRAKAAVIADAVTDDAFYVRDPAWRSLTTHCLRVDDPAAWKARAAAAGYTLGSGYGPLKTSCIRIATFPAVTVAQVEDVMRTLVSG